MGEIQAVADEQTRCLMGVALQSCLRVDLVLVFTGDLMMGKKGGKRSAIHLSRKCKGTGYELCALRKV